MGLSGLIGWAMTSNAAARAEVERLAGEMIAAGRRPNAEEIGRQIDGVSTRTIRRWVGQARPNGLASNGHRPASRPQPVAPTRPAMRRPAVKGWTINRWVAWPVAATVALLSASHIIDLALAAGHGWRAWLSPVALDGLAVAALLAWSAGRHRVVAALGIAVGVVGSVAANVLAVRPELVDLDDVSAVLAAFPPIALAVVVHLVRR